MFTLFFLKYTIKYAILDVFHLVENQLRVTFWTDMVSIILLISDRIYNNLPEVKKKQEEKQKRIIIQSNRMRVEIFKKVLSLQ